VEEEEKRAAINEKNSKVMGENRTETTNTY
jgi:hypothetical protein